MACIRLTAYWIEPKGLVLISRSFPGSGRVQHCEQAPAYGDDFLCRVCSSRAIKPRRRCPSAAGPRLQSSLQGWGQKFSDLGDLLEIISTTVESKERKEAMTPGKRQTLYTLVLFRHGLQKGFAPRPPSVPCPVGREPGEGSAGLR